MHFPEILIVLRHGQTDWNVVKKLQGRTNIPLNVVGKQQARAYGVALKQWLKNNNVDAKGITVFASPLDRAQETARLACQEAGIDSPIQTEPKLIEQSFGLWEGRFFVDVQKDYPEEWAKRLKDPLSYTPDQGESGQEIKARMSEVIAKAQGVTLLVGHFGIVRVLAEVARESHIQIPENFTSVMGAQNLVYIVRDGKLEIVSA